MAASNSYDIIIIGGGTLGLSAAYHCARAGKKVLVLEQYPYFNQRGSSAGYCRMWRVMYATLAYGKMALATSPMWDELEKLLGEKLIDKTGLLNFGVDTPNTPEGTMKDAMKVMDELKIPYTRLTSKELMEKYPFKNLPNEFYGLYQANGGTINVAAVLRGMYKLAKDAGADLRAREPVMAVDSSNPKVTVQTATAKYTCDKVIMCLGPYINELLAPFNLKINLTVWEMTFAYYQIIDTSIKYPMWFQFQTDPIAGGSRLFYGFPSQTFAKEGYLRLAVDYASHTTIDSPGGRTYVPAEKDIHLTMDYIQNHMAGVQTTPTNMTTCLVPLVDDNGYVLDFAPDSVPNNESIIICTAGWAFKFTPMFGKMLSELAVDGKTHYNIEPFSINRPGILSPRY